MNQNFQYIFSNQNFLDLAPYQAGYAKNISGESFGPCARNHYLFYYIISGAGTLSLDDNTTYHIVTGQGFLIFPSQVTRYWADQDHPWEYVWIEFDGTYASEIVRQAGFSPDSPVYRSSDRIITATMHNAMMELAENREETQFYKISKLYLFADCLIRSSSSAPLQMTSGNSPADHCIQTAFFYIGKNFMNDIYVSSIAEKCNVHRNQLLRIFKDKLGMGPQEYLIKYRMSKGAQLLLTTGLTVKEIGSAVGYDNQLHFSRAFKNVYGISPANFRKEYKCYAMNAGSSGFLSSGIS